MAYITGDHISIGYEGKDILKDISFEVKKGDYLYIVGENGAGKSTLMKTILGLIAPTKGEIVLGDGLQKNEIGYLPQQNLVQRDFPASVEEIVLSGCQGRMGLRPFYSKEEKALAKENLERMHLGDLSRRCYRELSGGQQQRVLLARALCATRKILLLDEPVAGLDPKMTSEMYGLIQKLNEEGIAIIMISHDVTSADKYASHILHVNKHAFFGTKSEYRKSAIGRQFLLQNSGKEGEN